MKQHEAERSVRVARTSFECDLDEIRWALEMWLPTQNRTLPKGTGFVTLQDRHDVSGISTVTLHIDHTDG